MKTEDIIKYAKKYQTLDSSRVRFRKAIIRECKNSISPEGYFRMIKEVIDDLDANPEWLEDNE